MANKQYISVIRLFEHCDIPTGDGFNLSRAKKQLQAEFAVTKDGFIKVDGYTYSRHDVMEEIEQPAFPARLAYHKKIWQSPQLLQLLENNTADLTTLQDELSLFLLDKQFDLFFSPYFAGPFAYLSRNLLADTKLEELGKLFNYEDFLQPDEREEAFRPVRIFLDENQRLLRNVNKENYTMIRPKILHWIEKDWFILFNHLPAEFYETKNDIIVMLINLGVAIQKSNRKDCKKISEQLISLQQTPENLREIIVSNHAIYMGSSGKSGGWGGNWFWIAWFIFMIIRAVSSDGCGSSSRNNFEYKPLEYQKYQLPDSLLKKLRKSGINILSDSIKK